MCEDGSFCLLYSHKFGIFSQAILASLADQSVGYSICFHWPSFWGWSPSGRPAAIPGTWQLTAHSNRENSREVLRPSPGWKNRTNSQSTRIRHTNRVSRCQILKYNEKSEFNRRSVRLGNYNYCMFAIIRTDIIPANCPYQETNRKLLKFPRSRIFPRTIQINKF